MKVNWFLNRAKGEGREAELPKPARETIDPRNCGLVDAVMAGWYQGDNGQLFPDFNISAEDVVADIGCGEGAATLFCANQGASVIFTDTDQRKIDALKEKMASSSAKSAQGFVSDSDPLPIKSATASKVISMEVLEHVEQPERLIKELYRIGSPGALYLLSVPDPVGENIQKKIAPSIHFESPNHINIFTREQFADLVINAGLTIKSVHFYGFYWALWMQIYWLSLEEVGITPDGATHDQIKPPFSPILADWAALWHSILKMKSGHKLRDALDEVMPKSQFIVAQKPFN